MNKAGGQLWTKYKFHFQTKATVGKSEFFPYGTLWVHLPTEHNITEMTGQHSTETKLAETQFYNFRDKCQSQHFNQNNTHE